jgi:DNA integrity scanning protein DisA with diadenylate cyclase activity
VITEDRQSYAAHISASETDYAHKGTDRWTAHTGEPLQARSECERTVTIDREGWHVRVETQSSLASDATRFLLENEVVAFEEDREVFRRAWRSEIMRDGV